MARAQAWQAHGNTMHALLYPVSNEREAMRRQGLQPKDHAKENMRRLKELAAQKAQTQILQQSATEPEPFKMQRFQGAQSQVRKWIEEEGYCMKPKGTEGGGMQRPATSGGCMRKGAGQSRGPASRESIVEVRGIGNIEPREKTRMKPAVPSRAECRQSTPTRPQTQQDYIRQNALATIRPQSATPQRPSAARPLQALTNNRPDTAPKHGQFGKVPAYLLKRKEEQLRQHAQVMQTRKEYPIDCPPGMRVMKNDDRLATLRQLEDSRLQLLKALADMPMIVDSLGLKQKKTSLEARLRDVEKALTIYSRTRVFVRDTA